MVKIQINIPDEMEPYAADLGYFVETMVRKLHTNRHKGVGNDLRPDDMLNSAQSELEEAWGALISEGQFEFAVECADLANFAFLASRSAWNLTREQYNLVRTPYVRSNSD